jgi:hypothetical protein
VFTNVVRAGAASNFVGLARVVGFKVRTVADVCEEGNFDSFCMFERGAGLYLETTALLEEEAT